MMTTIRKFILATVTAVVSWSMPAAADEDPWVVSAGAQLLAVGWEGENENSSDTDYDADDGGQFSVNVTFTRGRLYAGINFQGGEFEFSDGSPDRIGDQPLPGGAISSNSATVQRGEADFLLGYYFWEQVSLFLDLKNVTNEWEGEDYSLTYTGLGFGVAGFHPVSDEWTLFGSFGIVPLNIRADGDKIGDGVGSAIAFGGAYRLTNQSVLSVGLRNQHQEFEFDNGAEQTNEIGGLRFGFRYTFE